MVTRRGASLLLGAVAAWGAGRFLGVPELYVVAAATAALVVVAAVAVRLSTSTISVRRSVTSPRILHGAGADVVIDVRNDARLPAALLLAEDLCHRALAGDARFVVPGLSAGRTATLRYPLTGRARGRYQVGPLQVRVRDPFGVAQRVRRYRGTDDVVVYPRVEPLGEGSGPGSHHSTGSSATRRLFNTGDEFYTMREYVTGDDLRQVHWPSTAHRQTLMVRQQEQSWQVEATVFCDTRQSAHRDHGPDSALEKAITVAASLVWHLADAGYQLRLVTESDQRPPAAAGWSDLLERLAELTPSRVAGLGPVLGKLRGSGGEGLLAAVVATPPGNEAVGRHPDVRALLSAGRSYQGRLAFVVDGTRGHDGRAEQTAALLRAAGWRATTITPVQPLAGRWQALTGARARPAAYQPGATA